jgi:hypothetical protein
MLALPLYFEAEAVMPEYQMFFLAGENVVRQLETTFDNDQMALREARAQAGDHTIDVWQHDRRIALVRADLEPLVFNDSRVL